jgi:uncharacterized protein YukE
MGDKGENESLDPYSGKGYSAEEMPKDAFIPMEYNPLFQSDQNPLLPYTAGGPLLVAPNGATTPDTPFDSYRLNQMVDLVEPSVPQDLEDAGEALWDAARAIKAAERELKTYFEEAESGWEGEAKDAFHKWGKGLLKNTLKLSEYAGTVGSHLKGAGIGLAMVKSSMPKRDPDDDKVALKGGKGLPPHIAPDIADKSTPQGRKREKHRQEAINQMNKLSSYYQVALQHIQTAEKDKPVFSAIPDVGMPPAPKDWTVPGSGGDAGQGGSASGVGPYAGGNAPTGRGADHLNAAYVPDSDGAVSRSNLTTPHVPEHPIRPGTSIATDIDSAPPAPVVTPNDPVGPTQMPPSTSPPGPPPGGGPPTPGPVVVPPGSPPPPGRVGPGPQRPVVAPPYTGRTGPTGPTGPTGRQGLPMRPGPIGPVMPAQTGRQAGTNSTRQALGRPGMMGVPPATTGTGRNQNGRATNPGAPRAANRGGIVGGVPSQSPKAGSKGPNNSKNSNSRRSPGTVIDGQSSTAARRPTGKVPPVSGMGTGGAGTGGAQPGSGRKGKAPNSRDGVVGEPSNGGPTEERDSRSAIPGGTGLVVGGGQTPAEKEKKREKKRRRGYLTKNRENRSDGNRGSVPPVIE